jgi:hypothetical protein
LLRKDNKGSSHPRSQPIKTVPLGLAIGNGPSRVAQRIGALSAQQTLRPNNAAATHQCPLWRTAP